MDNCIRILPITTKILVVSSQHIKITGFLWHETESDWYKCYIIWVNKTTNTRTLFSSAFINNQYYMQHVSPEKVSAKKCLSHIFVKLTNNTVKNYFSLRIDIMDFFLTLECKIMTWLMLILTNNTQLGL